MRKVANWATLRRRIRMRARLVDRSMVPRLIALIVCFLATLPRLSAQAAPSGAPPSGRIVFEDGSVVEFKELMGIGASSTDCRSDAGEFCIDYENNRRRIAFRAIRQIEVATFELPNKCSGANAELSLAEFRTTTRTGITAGFRATYARGVSVKRVDPLTGEMSQIFYWFGICRGGGPALNIRRVELNP